MITPTELEKIIVTNLGTILQFKNHSKPIASKNKLNPLLDDLSCLIKNQISYEDITQEVENQKELEAYIVSLMEDKFA